MTIIRMSVANCGLGLFLTGAAVLVVAPGYAQSQKVVMEEMMVPSSDPGIEIYVRNKHPADMTTFRPDRTVLYVHGATYPASHGIRFASSAARHGWITSPPAATTSTCSTCAATASRHARRK